MGTKEIGGGSRVGGGIMGGATRGGGSSSNGIGVGGGKTGMGTNGTSFALIRRVDFFVCSVRSVSTKHVVTLEKLRCN